MYVIIMNYVDGHDLEYLIKSNQKKGGRYSNDFLISFAKCLFYNISVLHSKGIVHRDIKPGNIVYDKVTKKMVLIDFGFSCYAVTNDERYLNCDDRSNAYSPLYLVPEGIVQPKSVVNLNRYALDI